MHDSKVYEVSGMTSAEIMIMRSDDLELSLCFHLGRLLYQPDLVHVASDLCQLSLTNPTLQPKIQCFSCQSNGCLGDSLTL